MNIIVTMARVVVIGVVWAGAVVALEHATGVDVPAWAKILFGAFTVLAFYKGD